jgi:DNA-binding NarL/FixJ family response regulator
VPESSILFVLAINEPGQRSTLAARLSLAGADVVTAKDAHDPSLLRGVHGPAVLIIDEGMMGGRSAEWIESLLEEPCWRYLVVLCEKSPATAVPAGNPRLLYFQRAAAPAALAERLPVWFPELAGS